MTVEATSDVLIEKVRSAVTDDSGVYRIIDLRPGTYVVTFTLPGFNTYRREGLELASEFNATVNAELRVGGLQETITVTGESRSSTSSAKRQRTLDSELVVLRLVDSARRRRVRRAGRGGDFPVVRKAATVDPALTMRTE